MTVSPDHLRQYGEQLLEAADTEVARRNAVGRCYYACFHVCDSLANDLMLPRHGNDNGSHVALINALQSPPPSTPIHQSMPLERLGQQLFQFKQRRSHADYDLETDFDGDELERARHLTQQIFDNVQSLRLQQNPDA